jgi:RNA polymerase subunit RPABC4/transcription elongation factor Spt4
MWFFSEKCSNCKAKVKQDASFCPQCGEPSPRASLVCQGCGKELKGSAKFCAACGSAVRPKSSEAAPVDRLNRWRRSPDEFARRIEAGDLQGMLRRGLVVEPGTKALVFQGGALAGVVAQGTFDLGRPMPGVDTAAPATAILVDAGDTPLSLLYRDLSSREDVPVDVIVEAVVRLADPAALWGNLMHGREVLAIGGLAETLWSAGANVVRARVKQTAADELKGNLELKHLLENEWRQQVTESISRGGLELVELRFVEFSSPAYDKIRQRRAETFLAEQRIADAEHRATLNRRLREVLTRDRMDKFTSANDFEQFVRQTEHEMGMKEVIRAAEMEELKRAYESKREDAEIARRHLLEKLELEHELAVQRLHWTGQSEQLDHEIRQRRRTLEAQQQAEWSQFQQDLHRREALRGEHLKDTQAKADEVRMKIKVAEEAIELRRRKAGQEHEAESLRIQREQEEKDREAQRRLEEREQAARHELEKIRALSEAEQARLAADLKKTEVFKGMSEDQILALMAKDSPHVAAAIAERAKAQAQAHAATSTEMKALYEKILLDKESQRLSEADRLERVMARAMEAVERMAGGSTDRERRQKEEIQSVMSQGMDRMADVAVAKAGASGSVAAQAADVVCPNCHRQVPAGSKFCDNCGHQFFQ